jgi:protein O-mannosyl-transferase
MRREPAILLGLFLGTLALFWSAADNGFVDYDDGQYIFENPMVQAGLTMDGVRWAFTSGHASNWHPLTWLSHMLDVELFGLQPAGHHVTSLLFHAVNAVLVFLLFHRLTGAIWASALVAAVFAWHPLRVESVAWVSERKDVLSVFFGLLSLLAYTAYARGAGWRAYAASVFTCVLSLMAKPMLVTMPCILLLLDAWPLGRWLTPGVNGVARPSLRRLLAEKIPFFVLAIASIAATVWAQSAGGSVVAVEALPLGHRIAHALSGYLGYLQKFVWPMDLAVLYPLPQSPAWGRALAGAVVLLAISGWAVVQWRRRPWLATGWFLFLGTLVPVIGLVQVGAQAMADRYSYFPGLGLAVMLAWALREWTVNEARTRLAATGVALGLIFCAVLTHLQIGAWYNTLTLFGSVVGTSNDNEIARNNLAIALLKQGEAQAAAEHLEWAVRSQPGYPDARVNYGVALSELRRFDEAREQFRVAVKLRPKLALAHFYLGVSLASDSLWDEARPHLRAAVEHGAPLETMHVRVADVFLRGDKAEDAVGVLEDLFRTTRGDALAWHQYGLAHLQLRQPDKAELAWRRALDIDPDHVPTLLSLARMLATHPALAERGGAEAVRLAERARPLAGDADPLMLDTLAAAYANAGRFDDAVRTATLAASAAANASRPTLRAGIEKRLELYRARQPLREDGTKPRE